MWQKTRYWNTSAELKHGSVVCGVNGSLLSMQTAHLPNAPGASLAAAALSQRAGCCMRGDRVEVCAVCSSSGTALKYDVALPGAQDPFKRCLLTCAEQGGKQTAVAMPLLLLGSSIDNDMYCLPRTAQRVVHVPRNSAALEAARQSTLQPIFSTTLSLCARQCIV
jgi:hypothetical protein